MRVIKLFFYSIIFILFFACKKEEVATPIAIADFSFYQPEYFPTVAYTFKNNQLTKARFELGRSLFHDPILSSDSTVSCGSCHAQAHAFADHNVALSKGVGGTLGTRNSPSIANMAWSPAFMWDGGVNHIEVFSASPITNPLEMNEDMANVVSKLNRSKFYKNKFKEAYSVDVITDQKMLQALAQYMAMIVSADSKYDQVRNGKAVFTSSEKNGYQLFLSNCASCHKEPLFTDFSYRNNGLDEIPKDIGRERISQNVSDRGKFKVPSLRNVELTYPYMHDGRYKNLSQVLDHYTIGIKQSGSLDEGLKNGIQLTNSEKEDLIAFLNSLSDYSLIGNSNLSQ